MRTIRRILGDRQSGGVLCALAAYLLIVQALVGAIATGAMAGAPDPLGVICSPSTVLADAGTGEGTRHTNSLDCPCAALCGLAHGTAALAADAGPDIAPPAAHGENYTSPPRHRVHAAPHAAFAARAPPPFSV